MSLTSTPKSASAILTDALIIGAGPTGLFQAFELGLLDIKSHIVDSLPAAGGQCVAIYADKPIYDIPGIPYCTGQSLVDGLLLQLKPLAPVFHFDQVVVGLDTTNSDEHGFRFQVETSQGTVFLARCVFIAAGVGAFQPRRLALAGLEGFDNRQVFYPGVAADQAVASLADAASANPHPPALVVLGGDESAVARALALAGQCESLHSAANSRPLPWVRLVHRRDGFEAPAQMLAQLAELRLSGKVEVLTGQITAFESHAAAAAAAQEDPHNPARLGQLTHLDYLVLTSFDTGETTRLPVDQLWIHQGLSPRLGPLADWGLALERKQVPVAPDTFATSIPGIYAVGDINTYPGKKKLILCGFHEATLAAFAAAARLQPGEKIPLLYSTTSKHLHELLGVSGD